MHSALCGRRGKENKEHCFSFQTKTLVTRNINYRKWMRGKKNQENQNANLKPSSSLRPFGIILIVMDKDGDEIEKLKGKKKKKRWKREG